MDATPPVRALYRHHLATRVWHWVNAVAIFVLIGSGLGISNAHPRLYWGNYGANFDAAWAVLPRFPWWLTIPANYNLALSRRWHLFFALVLAFALLAYMAASLLNRHFQRDLRLARRDLSRTHLAEDVRDHLAFRFHDADDPGRYNTLQKWSYVAIVFGALPLAILTGLALSPALNAGWPWLLDVFGGRQSARSLHFLAMVAIAAFTLVHLALVILAGAWNGVRAMVTGWWRVPRA